MIISYNFYYRHTSLITKTIAVIVVFIFALSETHAQVMITLDSAISIALKNNYDIIVSDIFLKKTEQNVKASAGNFMPQLYIAGAWDKKNQNLNQNYTNGLEVNRNNVSSDAVSTSVVLDYTLFDGLQMFANRSRLIAENATAKYNLKTQIENTVVNVMVAYYEIVRQNAIIAAQKSNLEVTRQRLDITQTKKDVGESSGLELMQAKIDYNNQQSELLRQQMNLENAKAVLNDLLALNSDYNFEAADSIVINYKPSFGELRKSVTAQNNSIKSAAYKLKASEYFLNEMKSGYYPRINFNAGYDFMRNKNEAGFLLKSDNSGINFGISASWLLFNKLQTRNAIRQAKLDIELSDADLQSLKTTIDLRLLRAYNNFNASMKIVELEQQNVSLAANASSISLERFKSGRSSILELKDAQSVYQTTVTNYINAMYAAKLNEVELMRLNGQLVK